MRGQSRRTGARGHGNCSESVTFCPQDTAVLGQTDPKRSSTSLRPMRILVTGGAGFIGSHCAKRLAAAGEDVVVLDKLTYSGNRANLEGAEVEFVQGDIADREAVAAAGAGAEAILN